MMIPAAILDVFAAIMLLVAAVSTARLAVAGAWRPKTTDPDIDAAHVLMSIAMAGMLTASLRTLPDGAWEVIFGVLTAVLGWRVASDTRGRPIRAVAGSHYVPHLVHSAAMLYMFLALAGPVAGGSGSGMGMGAMAGPALRVPTLALVFALILAGYAVRDIDQLTGTTAVRAGAPALAGGRTAAAAVPVAGDLPAAIMSARIAAGCRIAMGVTMALMLIISI
jgi:Domain of unknown function (DUF5134)